MNLEDIVSSDISQTQKDKSWMICFWELPRAVRFIGTETGVGGRDGAWGIWEEVRGSYRFMEREFQLRKEETLLEVGYWKCEHLGHCLYT